MKNKFSSMGRVGIALVLALSLCLMTGVPVSADVSSAGVTVEPASVSTVAEYTITFDTTEDLAITADDDIRVEFPEGTTMPDTYVNNSISIAGTDVDTGVAGVDVDIVVRLVTIDVPEDVPQGAGLVVIFKIEAGIVNPATAGTTYTLEVSTSREVTPTTSQTYNITAPTVGTLEPDSGNMGDTMWVEITGTNFVGDADTDVSDTDIDFGADIAVLQTKYVSPTSIDCQIRIDAAGGARTVLAIAGGEGATFTANVTGTKQVDVWTKYTPTTDIANFDSDTLVFAAETATITLGITEGPGTANDQMVLIVHAATYTNEYTAPHPEEGLNVDQNYVTIKSLSGAASTFLEQSGADHGVSLKGIGQTIEDLTINRGGSVGGMTGVKLSHQNEWQVGDKFVIKGCTFSDWDSTHIVEAVIGGNNYGRFGSTITSGLIEGNTFIGNSRTAIWLETNGGTVDGIVIKGNWMLGCLETDGKGIMLVGDIGDGTPTKIEGNTISDMSSDGISFWTESGTNDTGKATITDNNISGCADGIDVFGAWVLTITENTIANNENGIKIKDGDQGAKTIKYNDITGNTEYGLKNEDINSDIQEAKYNWWDKIGGPSTGTGDYASTALGNGDAVSKNVTYDPWLTEDYATVIASGKRSYGSDAILLEKGWNTLSVPCGLKGSADTFSQIEALGDFLTDVNYVGGYSYDASDENWVLIVDSTTLEAGKGFCVQMDAASRFPVLYFDGFLDLPAYDMYEGWNLIGSTFGIDRDDDTGEGDYGVATDPDTYGEWYMNPSDALNSIQDSASIVVSPSVPGQNFEWAATVSTAPYPMYPGESYWVFMTANGTLAGFEVTPFCFEPGTMP